MPHDAPAPLDPLRTLEHLEALQDQVLRDLEHLECQLNRVLKEATRLTQSEQQGADRSSLRDAA